MNRNDTAYIHRNDEIGLIGSLIDGSFSEDIYISQADIGGTTANGERNQYKFQGQHATRNRKFYMNVIRRRYNSIDSFLRNSKAISEVVFEIDDRCGGTFDSICWGMSDLIKAKIKIVCNTTKGIAFSGVFANCPNLTEVIIKTENFQEVNFTISGVVFINCPQFKTLVLDEENKLIKLGNTNSFNNTCFSQNSSGGIIYIPQVLYNHLGDGSELDYKAATNWSIIDSYGTITWMPIEGSEYENE